MEALALKRENDAQPEELVEGQVYLVTLNDGSTAKMTPYNMRVAIDAHGEFGTHDLVGPIALEEAPDGSTATGGWGDVSAATWDGTRFVRPLLGSTPRAEVSAEELAGMISTVRRDELVDRLRNAYPSHNIVRATVGDVLAVEDERIAKVDAIEVAVVEATGKPIEVTAGAVLAGEV